MSEPNQDGDLNLVMHYVSTVTCVTTHMNVELRVNLTLWTPTSFVCVTTNLIVHYPSTVIYVTLHMNVELRVNPKYLTL